MEFSLNGKKNSVNSINWGKFKDAISYLCLVAEFSDKMFVKMLFEVVTPCVREQERHG